MFVNQKKRRVSSGLVFRLELLPLAVGAKKLGQGASNTYHFLFRHFGSQPFNLKLHFISSNTVY